MRSFHLAQVNVARPVAPPGSDELRGFMDALDPINALADRSPGFVWRLQTEDGNATAIRVDVGDDPMLMVNLSVWESLDALAEFTYRSDHRHVLAQRREWFEKMADAYLALWWIPAGTIPTAAEAAMRLDHLRRHGPTDFAFTFRQPFPAPDRQDVDVEVDDGWTCPTG